MRWPQIHWVQRYIRASKWWWMAKVSTLAVSAPMHLRNSESTGRVVYSNFPVEVESWSIIACSEDMNLCRQLHEVWACLSMGSDSLIFDCVGHILLLWYVVVMFFMFAFQSGRGTYTKHFTNFALLHSMECPCLTHATNPYFWPNVHLHILITVDSRLHLPTAHAHLCHDGVARCKKLQKSWFLKQATPGCWRVTFWTWKTMFRGATALGRVTFWWIWWWHP